MLKEPIIIESKEFKLVGMNFYGDPFKHANLWSEDNAIGQLWSRFGKILMNNLSDIQNPAATNLAYEIHIGSEQMNETGEYEVFTGIEVSKIGSFPVNCVAKILPATLYAEFVLKGEEIVSDWTQWIYKGWMPHSGYVESAMYSIQVYDETFKGLDKIEGATIKVLIPIKKAGDHSE